MDINSINLTTHNDGKDALIVELLNKINFSEVIDNNLTSDTGRSPDISYGTIGKMIIANMCNDYHPLYLMHEYFEDKDLEGIFHESIEKSKLTDDRFGIFLDRFYDAQGSKIFSLLSSNAFSEYDIIIKNINYDTTSKVMWGDYNTGNGDEGSISITYGHSKQKRKDKKQIKIGLGVADGVVVAGEPLDGNIDDKVYNNQNLDKYKELVERFNLNIDEMYYLADAALFTSENLKKAEKLKIKLITRMPGISNFAKELISNTYENLDSLREVSVNLKKGTTLYKVYDFIGKYDGVEVKCLSCYNESLKETKQKKIDKYVIVESKSIKRIIKTYENRTFACEADLEMEIELVKKKTFNKIKYHDINYHTEMILKKRRGRPSNTEVLDEKEYYLRIEMNYNSKKTEEIIDRDCIFILASNDLEIQSDEILFEYKKQISVEVKFKQLKSPQFVNALFLNTNKRIESLIYLMLITLMILSVAEHVVRRGLEKDNDFILGPGKIKMKTPTLKAIYGVFYSVQTKKLVTKSDTQRALSRPLTESVEKILTYLKIEESALISGCK